MHGFNDDFLSYSAGEYRIRRVRSRITVWKNENADDGSFDWEQTLSTGGWLFVAMQSKAHVLHSNFASLCFREWCFYTLSYGPDILFVSLILA